MKTKSFILLTNASGKKLDRITINIDDISAIEEPLNTETVGCIILVNDQLLAVKELYSKLITLLKNQYGNCVLDVEL